jgi:hypothetical protein
VLNLYIYRLFSFAYIEHGLFLGVGEEHISPHGNYLAADLSTSIEFQNFIQENTNVNINLEFDSEMQLGVI